MREEYKVEKRVFVYSIISLVLIGIYVYLIFSPMSNVLNYKIQTYRDASLNYMGIPYVMYYLFVGVQCILIHWIIVLYKINKNKTHLIIQLFIILSMITTLSIHQFNLLLMDMFNKGSLYFSELVVWIVFHENASILFYTLLAMIFLYTALVFWVVIGYFSSDKKTGQDIDQYMKITKKEWACYASIVLIVLGINSTMPSIESNIKKEELFLDMRSHKMVIEFEGYEGTGFVSVKKPVKQSEALYSMRMDKRVATKLLEYYYQLSNHVEVESGNNGTLSSGDKVKLCWRENKDRGLNMSQQFHIKLKNECEEAIVSTLKKNISDFSDIPQLYLNSVFAAQNLEAENIVSAAKEKDYNDKLKMPEEIIAYQLVMKAYIKPTVNLVEETINKDNKIAIGEKGNEFQTMKPRLVYIYQVKGQGGAIKYFMLEMKITSNEMGLLKESDFHFKEIFEGDGHSIERSNKEIVEELTLMFEKYDSEVREF